MQKIEFTLVKRWQLLFKAVTFLAFVIGILGLSGWFFDIYQLRGFLADNETMKFNSALGIFLSAGSLLALYYRKKLAARIMASLVLLISVLTLIEYLANVDLHIDQLFFTDFDTMPQNAPGRPALQTTVNLFLLARAILALSAKRYIAGQVLAAIVFAFTYAAMLGYLFSVSGYYATPNQSAMAFRTVMGLMLSAAGALVLKPQEGLMQIFSGASVGGVLARNTFTYFIGMAPVFVAFYLFLVEERHLSPASGMIAMFLFIAGVTLPLAYLLLRRINRLELKITKTNQELEESNIQLRGRNQELSEITEELVKEKENFEFMANTIPQFVWTTDQRGYHDFFNKRFTEYTGYDTESSKGTELWGYMLHPEDQERAVKRWQHSLETGEFYNNEYRVKGKDGNYRWFLAQASPMRNANGEIIRWFGSSTDIEESKQWQERLLREKERFEFLSNTIPQLVWTTNQDGYHDYFNQRWTEYTGYDLRSSKGREIWISLIHPDDRDRAINRWRHSFKTGEFFEVEYRLKSKEGNYRWFLVQALPMRNANGEIIKWFGTCTDIEESKQWQERLQREKESFEFMANTIPQFVWTTDQHGYHDYFNQRWTDYTGYDVESAKGEEMWTNLLHPKDRERVLKRWEHSLKTGEYYEIEFRLKGKDGGYRWFLAQASPMHNANGEIIKWFGSSTDIEVIKQLQEQLQREEERFRTMANSIPQLAWMTDETGSIYWYNDRWYDYTGTKPEEMLGWGWKKVHHPDFVEDVVKGFVAAIEAGSTWEDIFPLRSKDGEYRWFLSRSVPVRKEDGTLIGWFGTNTDVEEHKQLEEKLLRANEELKKVNDELDSFVYTASHDLKLPIISMDRIFNELIQSATFNEPDAEILVNMFRKSITQINNTIQDLTDIVKVQKNAGENLEFVSLEQVTEEVKLSLHDLIKETGAKISTDFTAAPEVYFSHVNLKSVIYNLVSNAIKYRSPERSPEVQLRSEIRNKCVLITVQDNGLGINLDLHKEKLFQMFKRFHSHVEGSGVGLYIVNRLVRNQGGYIELHSEVDKGTTFRIFLPYKDKDAVL